MAVGGCENKKERGGKKKGNEKRRKTAGNIQVSINVGLREAEAARLEGELDQRGAENEVAVRRNATEAGGSLCGSLTSWSMDWFLGRTYHKAAGLKLDEMDDGSCSTTIFTPDRTAMVRWQAVSAENRPRFGCYWPARNRLS